MPINIVRIMCLHAETINMPTRARTHAHAHAHAHTQTELRKRQQCITMGQFSVWKTENSSVITMVW
jgi:hypothetical protein